MSAAHPAVHPLAADLDHVLSRTEPLWRELDGSHLFVTGGTGFVGTWLLESLVWACQRLNVSITATVLTRDAAAFEKKAPHLACNDFVKLLPGDVRDFEFPHERVTHVIHGAFDSGRVIENPLLAFDTLVEGTRRVLQFAAGHPVQRMLFVSSGAVYGPQPAELPCFAEDYRGVPDTSLASSAYGEGKRVGELLCLIAASNGLGISIARCFSFIGPWLPLDAHFAAGNFLRDVCLHRDIVVNGDGRPQRSYLYAADLAIWLWTIFARGKPGRPYNVGGSAPISIGEFARLIAGRASPPQDVHVLGAADPGPVPRYVPCVLRAAEELGLQETVPLVEAIDRSLRWLRTHRHAA